MRRQLLFLSLSLIFAFACGARAQTQTIQVDASQLYAGYSVPQYKDATQQSLYVTMRDGVKIAIDVVLPKDTAAGAKLPTIINFTRYHRSDEGNGIGGYEKFFTSYGYACVRVDARGTGASFGTWPIPWSRDEIADEGEIAAWIVAQAWSNGKVGAFGNSYDGTCAQMLAVTNHPAVKAVIPRHYEYDVFMDIALPGGVFNDWMVKKWDEGNHELDLKAGVRPVDADKDKSLLKEALKMHAGNVNLYEGVSRMSFRDDRVNGYTIDDSSVHTFRGQIEKSNVAINNWGSWLDAGTADAVISSFMTLKNPQRTLVGAWNHGASQNASPYLSPTSQGVRQRFEWLRFFDYYLKGVTEANAMPDKTLFYYTMGEEKWKATKSFPVAGTTNARWYMSADNTLAPVAPKSEAGEDKYTVDFDATTGSKNRWTTQLGGQVIYPDRAEEDKKLLTYTSAPLAEEMEITGYPVINLQVSSTISDCAFFIYLEDIDETGKVTYLTEGELRAIHRKVSKDKPPYWIIVPYHSFKKQDALPLVAGQTSEITFGLWPTSVLIKKGHRLRVAIAGHDKSVFARYPATGTPVFTVERNKRNSSFIELPVIKRTQTPAAPLNLLTTVVGDAGKK
ncbi:MAG: CocE/NonD family hydrolase [Acidobacteria bacterium]|nr:CocE/NonD family hydrolase [Acidobacteriota bacterium]